MIEKPEIRDPVIGVRQRHHWEALTVDVKPSYSYIGQDEAATRDGMKAWIESQGETPEEVQ